MKAVVLRQGRLEVKGTLDEVPDASDLTRRSDGPPRIVVRPNGDV